MGAGRFVGRVGGLAVALGVGAAVTLGGHGTAWAEESAGDGAGKSSDTGAIESSSEGSSTTSPTGHAAVGGSEPGDDDEPAEEGDKTAEDLDEQTEPAPSDAPEKRDSRKRRASSGEPSREAPRSSTVEAPARIVRTDTGLDAPRVAQRYAEVTSTAPAQGASAATSEVTPQAPKTTDPVASVVAMSVESPLLDGVPVGPLVNAPALWVLAAAARRQLGSDHDGDPPLLAAVETTSPPNTPPTGAYTIGKPNTTSGLVTGTVKGVDADKDKVGYSAPTTSAKGGTVTVNATTGKFTYTPAPAARFTAASSTNAADKEDSFVVTVSDGKGGTGTVTVRVAIDPNRAPVVPPATVNPPNVNTGVVTGKVTATDPDKDKLTYTTTATSNHGGKVTINSSTGAFTYTPTQAAREAAAGTDAAAKQDSFTVTIKDAQGALVTQLVTVDVSPNQAPAGVTVTLNPTQGNGAITGSVQATDPDGAPGTSVRYSVSGTATKSKVTIDSNSGAITYTPTTAARHAASLLTGAVTTDSFTVSITDAKGAVTTQLVTVNILPSNAVPTANPTKGKPNTTTGVVAGAVNGADADKDKLTYTVTSDAVKGVLDLNQSTGKFTYRPSAQARLDAGAVVDMNDPARTDTFTVTITDAYGGSITKDVSLAIDPNRAPVTPGFSAGTPNSTTGVVTGKVTASDPDKDKLTYSTAATSDKGGKVTINASTGAYTYTPTQAAREAAAGDDAAKQDSFTVTIRDAQGATINHVVTVGVSPNKAPINPTATVNAPNDRGIVTGTVGATDPDPVGAGALKYSVASATSRGKVTINATSGAFTYTPTAAARHAAGALTGAITEDSFTVTITDAKGAITTKLVSVAIAPANKAPTATVTQGKPNATTGTVTGTVKGADADKDKLTYSTPVSTAKGTVTINATTGAFSYTPSVDARGAAAAAGATAADKLDSFTVTITDGHTGGTITKTVTVTIAPAIATSVTFGSSIDSVDAEAGVVTGHVTASGPDRGVYTFAVAAAPNSALGRVVVDPVTGQFTFTPTAQALVSAYSQSGGSAVGFTISVDDGFAVATVVVSAPVEVSADALTKIVARAGSRPAGVAVGADGTIYVINSGANSLSVLTPGGTSILTTVNVGASPTVVRVGPDGRVWVANGADGTVTVLDRLGATIKAAVGVGSSPIAIAFGDDGSVFVANAGDGTVSVINGASNTLARTITVGGTPVGIAAGPGGHIYVTDFSGSTIKVIDPTRGDALAAIDQAGASPFGIAIGANGTVYITHPLSNTVSILTPSGGTYTGRTVSVGATPTAITVGANGFVYVTNTDADTVTVINPHTFATTVRGTGINPNGVTVGPDGSIYVTNGESDSLTVIDGQSTSTASIPIGVDPNTVTVDTRGNISVTSNYDNTSTVINRPAVGTVTTGITTVGAVGTGTVITGTVTANTTIYLGANGYQVASPDGRYGYVINGTDGIVSIVNPATGTAVNIPVANPTSLQVSPDSRYAYVVSSTDGTVLIINPATGTGTRLVVGANPQYIQVSADSRYAYVTTESGTVSVINPATGTATTFSTGGTYYDLMLSPDSRYAYTKANGAVSVINPVAGTMTTIPVGHNLRYLVVSPDSRYLYITGDSLKNNRIDRTIVSIINPITGTATTIPLDEEYEGYDAIADVVVSPDGRYAYVTYKSYKSGTAGGYYLKSVSVINPDTGTATTIPVNGAQFPELMFSPDGRYAYITDNDDNLYIINAETGTARTITFDYDTWALQGVGNGFVYGVGVTRDMANGGYHSAVSMINPATGAVTTVVLPSDFSDIVVSPDKRYAYIVGESRYGSYWAYDTVSVLNFATATLATIPLGKLGSVDRLVVSPDSRYAYLTSSSYSSSTAWIINPATGTATTITLGGSLDTNPSSGYDDVVVSPDSRYAYITRRYWSENEGSHLAVSVINPVTGTVAATIAVGDPRPLVFSADGRYAYAAGTTYVRGSYQVTVTVIDTATATSATVTTLTSENQVSANIQVSPGSPYAYVTSYARSNSTQYSWNATASVIDPTKLTFPAGGVAPNYSVSTSRNSSVTFDPTANPFTPASGATITNISQPANGTAVLNGSRITYTPNAGFIGTDTFTYTAIKDGATGTGTIAVEVKQVYNSVPYQAGPTGTQDLFSTLADAMDSKDLQHGVHTQHVLVNGRQSLIVYIAGTMEGWIGGDQSKIKNLPSASGVVDENQVAVIKAALTDATEAILLVGYSQGGMDAQNIAANAARYGLQDQIKAVVTYGSPLVQIDRYPTVHFEDRADLVPKVNLFTPTNWIAGVVNSVVNRNVYLASSPNDFDIGILTDFSTWGVHGVRSTYEDVGLHFDVDTSSHWAGLRSAMAGFLNGQVVPEGYIFVDGRIVPDGTPDPSTQF